MVKGLDVFREFFAGHESQFVLIGGTAATLAMEGAGLNFRATKDLDIVLELFCRTPDDGINCAKQLHPVSGTVYHPRFDFFDRLALADTHERRAGKSFAGRAVASGADLRINRRALADGIR